MLIQERGNAFPTWDLKAAVAHRIVWKYQEFRRIPALCRLNDKLESLVLLRYCHRGNRGLNLEAEAGENSLGFFREWVGLSSNKSVHLLN